MVYDAARGVTILSGGNPGVPSSNSETWEWKGIEWAERAVSGPSRRYVHAMASDAARGGTVARRRQPHMQIPVPRAVRAALQMRIELPPLRLIQRTDVAIVHRKGNILAIHDLLPARALVAAPVWSLRFAARLRRARCNRARSASLPIPVIASISARSWPSARSVSKARCASSSCRKACSS